MKKLIATLAVLPVMFVSGSALASSPGQLASGALVLEAKNVTQNGTYSDVTNVACNEEVQYSTYLHNTGTGGLTNVIVSANLANGSVKAVPAEGASFGTSDTTTVNVASGGTLTYEAGTTKLYDVNGNLLQTLPDTITTSGVNIGTIPGSTLEYVNYRAKVTCSTPTPPTPTPTPTTPAKPAALPNTGAGDVAELFVGSSVFGTLGHYFVSRRNRR